MGKIYDATMKQASEEPPAPAALNGGRRTTKPGHQRGRAAEWFDFLDYSLAERTQAQAGEAQRSNGHAGAVELLEEEPASAPGWPVREVNLAGERLDPHLIMLNDCDPAAAEQYHRLAAALIAAAVERPLKRVLITSAMHGDGRTCVTLNLAGALARARRRVLVVDADLLRPSVLRMLGVEATDPLLESDPAPAPAFAQRATPEQELDPEFEPGSELGAETGAEHTAEPNAEFDPKPASLFEPAVAPVAGAAGGSALGAARREALVKVQAPEFTVLPGWSQSESAAELLASAEFGALLDELDRDFDFVLFDSAPLLAAGDAHLLLHYADTALLVVTPDKAKGGQVAQAVAPIAPEDIFGVVLNRAAAVPSALR
jgi:Mrp family chromosome partitioning ATPase